MRHNVRGRKFDRTSAHRKAMFANMASSLILKDKIETTLPKAKELRSLAEKLVTMAKKGTLHARRRAISIIRDTDAVQKLFAELGKRFETRNGGYTRILKLGFRHGDAAPMAMIEYIPSEAKLASEKEEDLKKKERKAKKEKEAEHKHEHKAAADAHKDQKANLKPGKAAAASKQPAKRSSHAHKASRSD